MRYAGCRREFARKPNRDVIMKLKRSVAFAAAFSASTLIAGAAFAQTEVQWWHAMGGALGEKLNKIANDFNASQSDYKITPVYKGNYTETLTAAIAAFRAKENPAIVQVFEVGTATMMAAEGAIYPVYRLMAPSAAIMVAVPTSKT